MPTTLLILIFATVAGLCAAVYMMMANKAGGAERLRRMRGNDTRSHATPAKNKNRMSFKDLLVNNLFEPVGKKFSKSKGDHKLQKDLQTAGYHGSRPVAVFYGAKGSLAVGLPIIFWVYRSMLDLPVQQSLLIAGVMGVLGSRLPNFWLGRCIKRRQAKLRMDLPDCLDLMVVSVEAGLGLDSALLKISEKLGRRCTEMASELHMVHLEVQAGRPRHKALKALGERTGVKELQSLVAKLIQAEKFGTSIARSLRVHADSIREKRRQLAEEKAGKTVVKMMIPLVFFIFPALFVVILGPAAMRVAKAMADGIL